MDLTSVVRQHGQGHVLRFLPQLTASQKERLFSHLADIDWAHFESWRRDDVLSASAPAIPDNLEPAPFFPAAPRNAEEQALYREAEELGERLLREGRGLRPAEGSLAFTETRVMFDPFNVPGFGWEGRMI